jgi:hypothetical protein
MPTPLVTPTGRMVVSSQSQSDSHCRLCSCPINLLRQRGCVRVVGLSRSVQTGVAISIAYRAELLGSKGQPVGESADTEWTGTRLLSAVADKCRNGRHRHSLVPPCVRKQDPIDLNAVQMIRCCIEPHHSALDAERIRELMSTRTTLIPCARFSSI